MNKYDVDEEGDITIGLFPHQLEFINSKAKHTGLIGGYSSGKTFAAIFKTLLYLKAGAGIVAYYLPTYLLIRDVAIPKFTELFTALNIPFTVNLVNKDMQTPYGVIHFRSMSDPDSIVGYEVGYSIIDETDILPTNKMREVFKRIISRNRLPVPDSVGNRTDVVGTPEGFKWAYEFFVTNASKEKKIIHGKTEANKYNVDGYVESLRANHSPNQLKAYLEGEFVNLTSGTVYNEFDRDVNCKVIEPDPRKIHIGMDFNITNMAAVVSCETPDGRHIFDEFTGVYDTVTMSRLIKEKYPQSKVYIYPDAAGAARSTSGKSDHDILRKEGFHVFSMNKNPSIRDRINKVNQMFRERKVTINPNTCTELVRALEIQSYDKNGLPDKSSGVDHELDGLGYLLCNNTKLVVR